MSAARPPQPGGDRPAAALGLRDGKVSGMTICP